MKKFLGIIVLGLCLICNNSFADETQKSMNDYINEGWLQEGKVEVRGIHRLYTFFKLSDKGGMIFLLCHVDVGEEDGSTFCYEP